MLAWQYNTIGVSDAITMGSDGELAPRIQVYTLVDPRRALRCRRNEADLDVSLLFALPSRHALLPPVPRDHRRLHRDGDVRAEARRQHLDPRV